MKITDWKVSRNGDCKDNVIYSQDLGFGILGPGNLAIEFLEVRIHPVTSESEDYRINESVKTALLDSW